MKILRLIVLGAVCLALGAAAGYEFALVREHDRLERNKALVRRTHAAVWSEPNVEKADKAARQLYAPSFVLHDWTGDDASGLAGVIKSVSDNRADFPDWAEHLESIIAEGDFVVDRFLSTGTQARDLQPIPHHSPGVLSRGKFLRMPEMEMFKVVDGKLAEQWDFADIWGAEIQLGLYDPDHWTESICGAQNANTHQVRPGSK
jgi:predicted ester cyclase